MICFEFLQRPENVLAAIWRGPITAVRQHQTPSRLRITRPGAIVWHPLEESPERGPVKFYADAEAVLSHLPRRGIAMVLKLGRDGVASHDMAKLVRKLRERLGLPEMFTLDACRHGGMTELEEAELTGRAR